MSAFVWGKKSRFHIEAPQSNDFSTVIGPNLEAAAHVVEVPPPASEGVTYDGAIPGGHWIDAGHLRPGDRLLNPNGTWAEVVSVKERAEPLDAWNLTVKDAHSYFGAGEAGAQPVWVHNSCGKFADAAKLADHFQRHGSDFGAKSAAEYERMAQSFLSGNPANGVLERLRSNGDIVRFDPVSNAFGVASKDGVLKTYYVPDPWRNGVSNLDYFLRQ